MLELILIFYDIHFNKVQVFEIEQIKYIAIKHDISFLLTPKIEFYLEESEL